MPSPVVSIGLPVYNGAAHLIDTLTSLLVQDYSDFELIISDNGSQDETPEICRGFQRKDSRVRFFPESENRGALWNMHRVFQLARGEFFMWAAHDDVFLPSYVRVCMNALQSNPDCFLAGTYTQSVDPETKKLHFLDKGLSTQGLSVVDKYVLLKKTLYGGHSVNGVYYGLYRRSVLGRFLPLPAVVGTDHLLLAKIVLSGNVMTIPEPLFIKREGGASKSIESISRAMQLKRVSGVSVYWVLERYFQSFIFASSADVVDKWCMSIFSWLHLVCFSLKLTYWQWREWLGGLMGCCSGRARRDSPEKGKE